MKSDDNQAALAGPFQAPASTSEALSGQAPQAWTGMPFGIWGGALLLALWGCFSANPVLTPFAVLLLPVFFKLLWRQGEPPVLLLACFMQWFQAAVAIFYANYYSTPLDHFAGAEFTQATWLSLIGVVVLAIGIRLALIRTPVSGAPAALVDAHQVSIPRLFNIYIATFAFLAFVKIIALAVPGLRQPLFALNGLQSVVVFMLLYTVMAQRRHFGLLAMVVLFEFVIGLLAFFAGFKEILFMLAIVILSFPLALKPARLAMIAGLVVVTVGMGVVWSAIKNDYREFLNQGTGQQVVLVSVGERLAKLQDLMADLSWAKTEEGLEMTILRLSYVEFFALTIANVPENVPHENGALWRGAFEHTLNPRLLFPNKPGISDSARTAKYTGVEVAGEEQGTSIGIGYMGESYIDFGRAGMFVPILLLGTFYGFIYRYFVFSNRSRLLGFSLAVGILLVAHQGFETSNIKLVGGHITVCLAMLVFNRVFGSAIMNWLRNDDRSVSVPRPGGFNPPQRSQTRPHADANSSHT